VAYRRDLRWVQGFQPLKVKPRSGRPARLREGGVYLVTGGLGGIGLELAASLARVARAKLVLTSRALFPPREEWPEWLRSHDAEDATSGRIRRMQALEELGTEVLVVRADVARESDMRAAIEKAQERFGALHGVIHAAGAEKIGASIAELDRAHCERQFRPKLQGLTVLAKVLEGVRLDFCMVQSSLSSVLGVAGFVSYTAAHLFMDAFACRQNRTNRAVPWICSNWDNWETWKVAGQIRAAGSTEFIMTPEEGADAFARVMGLEGAPHVVISTGDLQARIDRWITRSSHREARAVESAPRHARPDLATPYAAPRTDGEEKLAAIWQDLLGLERVGIHDNFFDLGGDSVLSIQVASRSAERGLRLSSHDVLEHQTIAELAAVAGTTRVSPIGGDAVGPVPLTPIQRWFFDEKLADPHHFNQAMLLDVRTPLELSVLEGALGSLVAHHDALRLRYVEREGGWRGEYAEAHGSVTTTRIDLAGRPESEQGPALERAAAELQAGLDLSNGPLLRAAYFDLGPDRPGRLLLIIHHLLVDVVSWRILQEDLQKACRQLDAGQPVRLAAPTTSFGRWAQELARYAQSPALEPEAEYWLSLPWGRVSPVPVDKPGGVNAMGSTGRVSVTLEAEETRRLLEELPERHKTQINDVLLAALATAFQAWTGRDTLLVDLEGHGREAIVRGADLSRTVGWFTTLFPVLLDLHGVSEPLAALKRVKEQLRAIPGRGIGYGLLRYLRGDEAIADGLRRLPRAEVSFLYLGRLDPAVSDSGLFRAAAQPAGPLRSPRGRRQHLLEITGHVTGGQLSVGWTYSEELHHRSTIEALAEAFVGTLRMLLRQPESAGFETRIPSDFPGTRLDGGELEAFLSVLGQPRGAGSQ
jgi:non-ribosomal peptide synthase protein (TIGR01720 family)